MTSCNRLCPSVEGSASPLITHRIGVEVCLARQRTFFHKCHRCIYRGQAANWEPEQPAMAMINIHAAEEAGAVGVKQVALPIAARSKAPAAVAAAKAPKGKAAKAPKAAKSAKLEKTAEAGA